MRYEVILTKQALKDAALLKRQGLLEKARAMIEGLKENPYQPPYEKLGGNLRGAYSRRINIQHRMVYTVDDARRMVKLVRMWAHYE